MGACSIPDPINTPRLKASARSIERPCHEEYSQALEPAGRTSAIWGGPRDLKRVGRAVTLKGLTKAEPTRLKTLQQASPSAPPGSAPMLPTSTNHNAVTSNADGQYRVQAGWSPGVSLWFKVTMILVLSWAQVLAPEVATVAHGLTRGGLGLAVVF